MSNYYGVYQKGWCKNASEMKQAIVGQCLKQAIMVHDGIKIEHFDEFNGYMRSVSTRYNERHVYDSAEEARNEVRWATGPDKPIYWIGPCNSNGYYLMRKSDFSNPRYFFKWMTTEMVTPGVAANAYSIYKKFMESHGGF